MNAIDAMKQIQAVLEGGEILCEVTAASMLSELIKREEAQTVEPVNAVYLVATGEITNGMEQYTRHDVCPPLCDAEKLFAQPAPTGGERSALLDELRTAHRNYHGYWGGLAGKAYDMLAADAQKITTLKEWQMYSLNEIARLETCLANPTSQQVAVPQKSRLSVMTREEILALARACGGETMYPPNHRLHRVIMPAGAMEAFVAMLAAVPKPPQARDAKK